MIFSDLSSHLIIDFKKEKIQRGRNHYPNHGWILHFEKNHFFPWFYVHPLLCSTSILYVVQRPSFT